jgi:cell division protein FtsL
MFSISLQKIFITISISIILILSGHYLWNYLKNTYTEKKTKDLINSQVEKYKKIVTELQETIEKGQQNSSQKEVFINEQEKNEMNNDLAAFAKSLE